MPPPFQRKEKQGKTGAEEEEEEDVKRGSWVRNEGKAFTPSLHLFPTFCCSLCRALFNKGRSEKRNEWEFVNCGGWESKDFSIREM